MKLSLKFKEVFKHMTFSIGMVIVFIGGTLYYYGLKDFKLEPVSGVFFLLPVLIVIILTFEYLKYERKRREIVITDDYLEIVESINKGHKKYSKEDIIGVTLYGGVSYFQKSKFAREFRWLPFEIFHFAEINLRNNPPIYITSFMDVNLFYKLPKLSIFKEKTKYKKTRFASIFWNTMSD